MSVGLCIHNLDPFKCARCNMTKELAISPQGGIQSKLNERPDLLPPRACLLISRILGVKAQQYGEWNWKKINNQDNLAHAMNHIFMHIQGDRSEFHPGNAACRILFFLDTLLEIGHDYDLDYLADVSEAQAVYEHEQKLNRK